MIKSTILILTGLIISTISFSQELLISDIVDPYQQNKALLYSNNANVIGSPFLFDNYCIGAVKLNTGNQIDNLQLKYDAMNDQLQVKLKNGVEQLLSKDVIESFKVYIPLEEQFYTFIKLKANNEFVRALYEGEDVSLYRHYSKKLVQGHQPNGYNSGNNMTSDKFVQQETVFIKFHDSDLIVQLKKPHKNILDVLTNDKETESLLKDYIKEKSLNLREDHAITSLMMYYEKVINQERTDT